jgi:hypothetical protein
VRSRHILAWLIALTLVGGHTAGLQVVAWVGMLMSRAPVMAWSDAVHSTFSGREPCPLCCAVSALRDAEADGPQGTQAGKAAPTLEKQDLERPDFAPADDLQLLTAAEAGSCRWERLHILMPASRAVAPETPPPQPVV